MQNISSLFSGILFGIGLAISDMINPAKIVNFLDVTGNWDPSLAFVMGGAVIITVLTFTTILKRSKPIFSDRFELIKSTKIDTPLILGSSIFGIGWALSGLCPGPAIASVGFLSVNLLIFVVAMLLGSFMGIRWLKLKPDQDNH